MLGWYFTIFLIKGMLGVLGFLPAVKMEAYYEI